MAKFTAGPGAVSGIDFTTFDVADLADGSNPTIHDSKHYKLEVDATHYDEFFGTGFAYKTDFDLIGGTLNEIVTVEGTEVYRISGLSMSVATASKFVDKNDSQGFLAAIFAGADSITGSGVADDLLGFNGNDTIDGLGGSDTLNGGIGNDSLIGGAGTDSMDGAAGNDTYDVDSAADVAVESGVGAAGGTDTVRSSAAAYTLGANIESLILTGSANIDGTGNALANTLTGNTGDNELSDDDGKDKLVGGDGNDTLSAGKDADTLDGGIGNDSLDGGGGGDSMAGGAGDDSYKVDSPTDKVTETLANDKGGGEDTVFSSVTFTLGNYLDNLVLLDSVGPINGTGNTLDNELTGNGKDNKLSGLAGADTIAGGAGKDFLDGGVGADSMAGGEDNDVYVKDSAGDNITESGTTDGDELRTNLDTVTSAVAGIEHYTFTGTKAVTFTGDGADNSITGTAAADKLDGAAGDDTVSGLAGNDTLTGGADNDRLIGGMGADAMDGGLGDDTYGIDNAGDTIADAGGTHDTVESTVAIDLTQAKFLQIEDATLLGMAALNLIGSIGANILIGNAGANKIDGGDGADVMDGGKGNDTYFVDSGGKDKVSEDDLGGTGGGSDTVISKASFELGDNIENLTLIDAAVTGTGNELKNTITGNDLGNTLDGGADIDKLVGGKGNDTYIVDNAKDVVTESVAGAPGGTDTVESSDSFILGMNVEHLILTGNKNSSGTGNALDNEITGDNTNNALFGLAGIDTLDGGGGNDTVDGGTGIDDLTGGTGNDTYMLDTTADVIHEAAGDSSDTAAATFAIDLGDDTKYANIENATLLGTAALTAAGDAGNNYLTGNSGANTLTGLDGIDTLDGKGGVDSLDGGKGNDVYYADNAGEKIVDSGPDTADEVRASVTFSLANLATIENAMLLGLAALNLSGNALANVLTGNEGNNKVDGGGGTDSVGGGGGNDTLTGGSESDTLAGGKGDDVYVVDGGETIVENNGEGIDTVQSALTYNMAAFANVENLTLTGTGDIGGTGNAGANTVTGNNGKNALDGGAGADTMAGGMGNDTYTVDDAGDKVTEASNAGIDTVLSSLPTYTLPAYVENLTLTGSGDISGTGNTLGNLITGNGGMNTLDGAAGNDTLDGGLGSDALNGGAGNDTYVYAAKDEPDTVHTGDTGGKGADHVSIVGAFDWDVRRVGNDLLVQAAPDEAAADADFDPNQAIRIVDQYAGAGIAFFQGDFGKDNNLFYGDDPNLTTVFTPGGLTGKDQGHNAEVVEGTSGNDTVNGGGGQSDFLYGNDGDDRVNSQSASDEFAFLSGGKGDDTLTGAAGSDAFRGDEGNDLIDGGDGFDRASYRLATAAVHVDLTLVGAQPVGADQGSDTLISIEALTGSKFNDTLIGDSNDNNLNGLDGNDSLSGNGGFDFLAGGAGNDTLAASALKDFAEAGFDDAKDVVIVNLTGGALAGVAAHTAKDGLGGIDSLINIAGILAGDFNDTIFGSDADEFFEPGGGDDSIDGGAGFDDVDYFSSTDAVNVSLLLQSFAQTVSASQGKDTFINIEGLDGSAFNDTLTGDAKGNFLKGRAGADSLIGGDSDDRLRGGAGNDTLDGGLGFDEADYLVATAAVKVDLNKQGVLQVISAAEGSDYLWNIDDARGSAFNDTLIGDAFDNNLTGSAGNDSLSGAAGFDALSGGAGNDALNGGTGTDRADYRDATEGVNVDLSKHGVAQVISATEGSDVLTSIEDASGSAFNDTLLGDSGFNFLNGRAGDDSLNGGAEYDILMGGAGADTLQGGVDLGAASYLQDPGGIIANLSTGTVTDGFGSVDKLFEINGIIGSQSADTMIGGFDNDVFEGMGGDDSINGGTGFNILDFFDSTDAVTVDLTKQNQAQTISASQGKDTFVNISDAYGSFFNDTLIGNNGDNILFGRDGNDRFAVAGSGVVITQQDVFDKLYSIEEIDLTGTGGNSLTLSALDVLQTSNTGGMRILGNSGDSVSSQGQGWVFQGQTFIGPDTYNSYTATVHVPQGNFQVSLLVDTDVTQTIS